MANKATKEFRCTDGEAEYRVDEATGKKTLIGYAAVFDDGTEKSQYRYYGIIETIQRGAFTRALRDRQDVRGLFNHDSGSLLGRVSSNTLRLSEDDKGLRYEIDLPDTTLGRDLEQLIQRRDLSGSSFGFRVKSEKWERMGNKDEDKYKRSILDVDLIDVGPVTFPAYTGTQSQMRSEDIESLTAQAEAAISEAEAQGRSDAEKNAESAKAEIDALLLRGKATKIKLQL